MANQTLFFSPFLAGFGMAVMLLFALDFVIRHFESVENFKENSLRRMGGGVAILAALFAIFSDVNLVITRQIEGFILGSIAIFIFGLWDDMMKLGWRIQLLFQGAIAGALFVFGFRIFSIPIPFSGQVSLETIPWGALIGFFALVVWVIIIINALNWADGVDGLLPSLSLVAFGTIFLLSLAPHVNQPPIGILSMALFGSIAGLFLFNRFPARFIGGTSGSYFVGFSLASLSILSGTKIATALLVLLIPILDAVWVIIERVRSGQSPFRGDFRHLHYRLRDRGWSDRKIAISHALFALFLGGVALSTGALGKTVSFLFAGSLIVIFLYRVRDKNFSHIQKVI